MARLTVAQARGLLGWTQQKLANEAGCPLSTLSSLEIRGTKRTPFTTARRIEGALQRGGLSWLTADDLFAEDNKVA